MTSPRILVAGIGNVLLGDDGFGVEVARRLARRELPDGVRVVDFGVRGFDLTYALLEGYDAAILVDATHGSGPPGTLYLVEPDVSEDAARHGGDPVDTHGMNPARVLALVRAMGGHPPQLRVVGCEPATFAEDDDTPRMGLSAPVAAAVEPATGIVEELIARIRRGEVPDA